MAEVCSVVIKELGTFLKANMPSLVGVINEFPEPNEVLKYPSVSLFVQEPKLTPMSSWVVSKGAKITSGPDIDKYPVRRAVGQYDFSIQLDFWTRNKMERSKVSEELFKAMHLNSEAGVKLQLTEYFGQWIHFIIVSQKIVTDGNESTRNEWRLKVDIVANCFAVNEKNEYLMETIENNLETPIEIASEVVTPGDLII